MSFSINTNISSLQAQNYLQQSSQFQSQTIAEVTSGLRIVNSGDDAAGLAVANGLASDQAVLTQGIQNANDGLNTLQTIDGGMSNVSTLLNRASTLATESASGTFSGDRDTLNAEFQSVLTEINRQAQSIGLNQGGQYAKDLSVFIGGGQASGTTSAIQNGSIDLNLSNSAIDTQSLGLTAYNAQNSTAYDLGTGTTSVANVLADTNNTGSEATSGYTQFTFTGSGFGDTVAGGTLNQNAVTVSVNLNNVTDTTSLVNAINNAISSQGNQGSTNDTAFKNAGISAQIETNSNGQQMLAFSSSNGVFQVQAGDLMANALMGNFASGTTGAATTTAGSSIVAGGTQQITNTAGTAAQTFGFTAMTTGETQALTFTTNDSSGAVHSVAVNLAAATSGANVDAAIEAINNTLQTQDDPTLANIVAFKNSAGDISFASSGQQFTVTVGTASAAAGDGIGSTSQQGTIFNSNTLGATASQDISTQQGAENAVTAIATAVQNLGTAQAAVGKGENNLNYAINLAQSQVTNEAASESSIRDANLAQEAANLTKAQILMQAGTAALSQANSAPQQLLSLLQGH